MLLKSTLGIGDVERLVMSISQNEYRGNLTCELRDDGATRDNRRKVRFTLAVADSFGSGARTAASGRHMPKASWQAHYTVMRAVFDADPQATLQTALITYTGRAHFLRTAASTGDRNVGSQMEPRRLRDTMVDQ